MSLAKSAWKILVAVKDGLVLLFMLLFFGTLYAVLSSSPNPGRGNGGALLLNLDGVIVEQPEAVDPRELVTGAAPMLRQTRLVDVLHALKTAEKDDSIKAVVLDLNGFWGGGQVALENIADALAKVRAAKKTVLVHAIGYDDSGYLLAARANEIWLDPMGAAYLAGPGGSRPYFKGLLDRFGVNVHVYRVGKFKSFIEPYTRQEASPEARQANVALTSALWTNWLDRVAKARPKAQVKAYAADPAGAAGGSLAEAAVKAGLVDKLGDRTAFDKRVAAISGANEQDVERPFNHTLLNDYVMANPPSQSGDAIGVIQVAGSIVDGNAPSGTAGGDTIAGLIKKAVASEKFKALVVRVDSGGGSALASEQIRQALLQAKAKGLPVVTSMGNVAASGGYWVAMAGDKVFAEPSTITGSIGVFGIIPTFERTLANYGVKGDGVKTTPLSGQPDVISGTNAETDRLLQAGVDNIYTRFLSLVSGARKMPVEKVNEIAQGRVWDGGTARQLGLIDGFGSLDTAVAEAAKLAKLDVDDVYPVVVEDAPGWVDGLLMGLFSAKAPSGDVFALMTKRQQASLFGGIMDAEAILSSGSMIQARCLECTSVPRRAPTSATLWTWFRNKAL